MFCLVADVASYPDFLPWCRSASSRSVAENEVEACVEMARGPLHKSFTTRNSLTPGQRIDLRLVDGPFQHLKGAWTFEPLGEDGCKVALDLEFDFKSRLVRALVGPVFNEIANTLVDAFCKQARRIHEQTST